ncbi:hypothetical protein THRCLA_04904 [Thraustotheca clavata]|uniref:CLASP N-terminal domain-containing protein n=1 Tax=Thraustotheca clavata TaxID=74557 RepID=A0A1V9ZXN0_9STRA|nr:hypothetical protein THRCLA_04904 [Thraustotheca clavata]
MEELAAQSDKCLRVLREDAEWQEKTQQLLDLQKVVTDMEQVQTMNNVIMCLKPLAPYLVSMMGDIRSAVVKTTCEVVAVIAATFGVEFAPFVDEVLVGILNTAYVKTRVCSLAGEKCLEVISKQSRYSLTQLQLHFQQTKHAEVRLLCISQFPMILAAWNQNELEEQYSVLKSILVKALQDNESRVRQKAREVLCLFADMWEGYMDEFVQIPSRTMRESIIKEYPTTTLAQNLRSKFGEPTTKRTPLKQRFSTPEASMTSEDSDAASSQRDSVSTTSNQFPEEFGMSSQDLNRVKVKVPSNDIAMDEGLLSQRSLSSSPSSSSLPDLSGIPAVEEKVNTVTPVASGSGEQIDTTSQPTSMDVSPPSSISFFKRMSDFIIWLITALSALVAVYGIAGAITSYLLLNSPSQISMELQDLEDSVAATRFRFHQYESSMDAWMQNILNSMESYRQESSQELAQLKLANIAWNRSMRQDMAAFTDEFASKIRFGLPKDQN